MKEQILRKKGMTRPVTSKEIGIEGYKELDTEKHVIEIKFAAYGVKDSDNDILVKGCFAKSIQERGPESSTNRKIAYLWQHDMRDPIGKILSIEEREDGAYATVRLSNFDAVPNAKRAYHQLKDGDINQFSFGFSYVWDKVDYDEENDAYIVKEVKLYEISIVTLGANEMTEYIGELKGEDLDTWAKSLYDRDNNKFNRIKDAILKAEPGKPLTCESMFEELESKLNK